MALAVKSDLNNDVQACQIFSSKIVLFEWHCAVVQTDGAGQTHTANQLLYLDWTIKRMITIKLERQKEKQKRKYTIEA